MIIYKLISVKYFIYKFFFYQIILQKENYD